MSSGYVVIPCPSALLKLEAFISEASHFSNIGGALGTIMYLLEPEGEGGGMNMGLFYCLILSGIDNNNKGLVA
jgi:hypothetical protein